MFLDKDDLIHNIDEDILDEITEFDDDQLDDAIDFAVEFARGHLNARYDVDAIFTQTGTDRNVVLKNFCVDIALWKLHSLINPRKVPKFRKQNYDDAVMWFDGMKDGTINQPGLPVPVDGSKDYIKYGSNPRRENHI